MGRVIHKKSAERVPEGVWNEAWAWRSVVVVVVVAAVRARVEAPVPDRTDRAAMRGAGPANHLCLANDP
jgi:anti-sigma-K factor RskA